MTADQQRWRPPAIALVLRVATADAVWLAGLAIESGVLALEVTTTRSDHLETLTELRRRFPDAELGVGSIRTPGGIRDAARAGAGFAVTPVLVPGGAQAARDAGIPLVQGAATPSEINQAWQDGADVVKVFPADCLGGPRYIKSLLAPMPELALMASGGVDPATAAAYFDAGAACVALGSSIAPSGALDARDAGTVRRALADLRLP